jgi:hypothetical protein
MKKLLSFAVLTGLAVGAGQLAARYGRRGEDTDDDFRRVALANGQDLRCHAEELRGADLLVGMGGISLDLTGARLAPEGAVLRVRGAMGGVNVEVPDSWRVTGDLKGLGGLNLDTTPADDLPADAPHLHLDAVMVLGGVNIEGVSTPDHVVDLRATEAGVRTAD